jgi:hypothetical protein
MRISSLIVILTLFCIVLILWLPFNLESGITGDAWIFFMQADEGDMFSQVSPLRLFIPVPWIIAQVLSPGEFAGINLVALFLIFGKSWLVFLLLTRLNTPRLFAFASAVLVIVIPVDQGIFYLGALAIHFAVFTFLLALLFFVEFYRTKRIYFLAGMALAQLFSVATYEVGYPLILLSPALLLLIEPKIDKAFIRTSTLWYMVPVLNAVWYLSIAIAFPRAVFYQSGLLQADLSIIAIVESLFGIYQRHLLEWLVPAYTIGRSEILLAVIVAIFVISALIILSIDDKRTSSINFRPGLFILLGMIVIAGGVAVYLPSSLRDATVRTYYYSSIGAAVVFTALAFSISYRLTSKTSVYMVLIAIITVIGLSHLFMQHRDYVRQSEQQKSMLLNFLLALPKVHPESSILIIDDSQDRSLIHTITSPFYLEYMVPALYADYSIASILCSAEEVGTEDRHRCRFSDDGFTAPSVRLFTLNSPYNQLITVRYNEDGFHLIESLDYIDAVGYDPLRLIDLDSDPPPRIYSLLGLVNIYEEVILPSR